MDPLERSGERCSLEGHCGRSMHERPLSELEVAKLWSRDCVKSLLGREETNELAHQLIRWSLSSANESNETTSENGASLLQDLVELSDFEGLSAHKIGRSNLSSTRLDLNKLSARLPAQENSDVPLEALGHEWQVSLSAIYSLTAVVSILLNLITVIVLYRAKPSELRKYLINLAISDLCMSLFSIPFTYREYMLGYWDYPPFLCPVVRLMVTLAVYVSVCTMVVIGVNRHVAIVYPMKKCSEGAWKCGKNWVILGIWLSGLVISLPEYLMFSATQFCYNQKFHLSCRNTWGEQFSYYYTIFIFMTTFVIPFMLLCYFYSSIGIQLKHREMPGNANATRDLSMQTKRAKVVKMLIVVVVMFAIFWLPLQAFSLIVLIWPALREVGDYGGTFYNLFVGTYFIFHWMSMAHSCLNPLIYCFMNPKFRKDLRELICTFQWVGCREGPPVRRRAQFGSHSTSTLRPQNYHQNSSLRSNKQQEQFAHCVRLKLDALNRIDKLEGRPGGEDQEPTKERNRSRRDSCSRDPTRSGPGGSGGADSNQTASNTPNGLPADGLNIGEKTPPDGEWLLTTPLEREISARGESGAAAGPPTGRCERVPARRSIEIATLPEVNEEEEEEEEKEEEATREAEVAPSAEVFRPSLVEPTRLVVGDEPIGARATQSSSQQHESRRRPPPPSPDLRGRMSQGRGEAAPAHRKEAGKLAGFMRSLSASTLFGSFGSPAGNSAAHQANITNV